MDKFTESSTSIGYRDIKGNLVTKKEIIGALGLKSAADLGDGEEELISIIKKLSRIDKHTTRNDMIIEYTDGAIKFISKLLVTRFRISKEDSIRIAKRFASAMYVGQIEYEAITSDKMEEIEQSILDAKDSLRVDLADGIIAVDKLFIREDCYGDAKSIMLGMMLMGKGSIVQMCPPLGIVLRLYIADSLLHCSIYYGECIMDMCIDSREVGINWNVSTALYMLWIAKTIEDDNLAMNLMFPSIGVVLKEAKGLLGNK